MGTHDLPDMYVLGPQASCIHIRQIPHAHVNYYTYSCLSHLEVYDLNQYMQKYHHAY